MYNGIEQYKIIMKLSFASWAWNGDPPVACQFLKKVAWYDVSVAKKWLYHLSFFLRNRLILVVCHYAFRPHVMGIMVHVACQMY